MKVNVSRRIDNFREVLERRGLDAIILANFGASASGPQGGDYNLYYLSNLLRRFPNCFLVLTADDCRVWVEKSDLERAAGQSWLDAVEPMEDARMFFRSPAEFADVIRRRAVGMLGKERVKIGVDGRYLASSVGLSMVQEGVSVTDVSQDLEECRLVKDGGELEAIRRAARVADVGVEKVMKAVAEGVSERELAALAECEMRREGAECFWWKTLVNSGPDAARWGECPTERRIEAGDVVGMDFTPVCEGYAADIARTFVYGGPPAPRQMQVLELTKRALDEGVSALRSGVSIGEVISAATAVVKGSPYEEYFVGPGHGIGLYNDISPIFFYPLSKVRNLPESYLGTKLVANVTVAMEIVLTVPGIGRVCLEDDYLITDDGAERLTAAEIVFSVPRRT